jgi:hypothetical protein
MVDISHETQEQTNIRLRGVIQQVTFKLYDQNYAFTEFSLVHFPHAVDPNALAVVRDDEVWSQLIPASERAEEKFVIFRFHFPPGIDNSGFVGWLATHLKQTFGTGLFVVCGQNSQKGGIFDYWGCPTEVAEEVIMEVKRLIGMS